MPRLEIRISRYLKNQALMRCQGNLSRYIKNLIRKDITRNNPISRVPSILKTLHNGRTVGRKERK